MSLSVHGSVATAPPPAQPRSTPVPAAHAAPTPVHSDTVSLSSAAQKTTESK